jgi:hypothetical protein
MSIRPVQFFPDGSIEVLHDELGHGGTISDAEIIWSQNMDGTPNHNFLVLTCPFASCGSVSTWPVGGGADAVMGQQMFVNKIQREGCVCLAMQARGALSAEDAKAHVKELVIAMDGESRWVLDEAPAVA